MIRHLLQLGAILLGAAIVGWMVRRRIRGGIMFLFVLVAVAATYPLAFASSKLMLDSGGATDVNVFLWNFWWVKKALLELHVNPYFTDFIYYPHGTTLTFHSMALPYALASIPFQLIWPGVAGLCIATNAAILFSFWLAGYATYLLAHELVKNRSAAIAAGLAFTLCNFHFSTTVRLHAMALEWLPLFGFCAIRMCRAQRIRDGIWTGLALAATFYSSLEYAYFLAIWAAIFCSVCLVFRLRDRLGWELRVLRPLIVGGVLLLILTIPFWRGYALERNWEHAKLSTSEVGETSMDLVDFVLPNDRHPLYRRQVRAIQRTIHDGDEGLGLGQSYTVLALAAFGALAALRKRDRQWYGWAAVGIVFGILSLGTTMRIGGYDTEIALPLAWLRRGLPLLDQLHMPIRFLVMAHLSAAVLCAYGFREFQAKMAEPRKTRVSILVIGVLLFEMISAPMVMQKVQMPPSYGELGRSGAAGTLIDWPPGRGESLMCEVFHQTAHGRRLVQDVSAFLPRVSVEARAEAVGPGFVQLRRSILNGEMLGRLAEAQRGEIILENIATLKRLGVRTIVLRRKEMNPEWLASAGENILRHVSAKVSEYEDAVVFELPFRIDE